MRFDSTRLLVKDFSGCFRFYRDLMGFQPKWGDDQSSYASFVVPPDAVLALFRRDRMAQALGTTGLPPSTEAQDRFVLVFEVEDVDAVVMRLSSQGAMIIKQPQDYPDWTIRSAYLRDPDGNLIELYSLLEEAKWSDEVAAALRKYATQYGASASQETNG